jgi:hypothetical protein
VGAIQIKFVADDACYEEARQLTVKVPVLVAVPPGVTTTILPVFAPAGTVAVICV